MSPPIGQGVVYISYDGLSDPLGKSQVLPYVTGLADRGHNIELITFEKAPNPTPFREKIHRRVRWTGLRYHKTPTLPATALDMTQGALASLITGALVRADLVHVRSYVAATCALPMRMLAKRPLLFDMRGLWPDERVADGNWSQDSKVYEGAKKMEKLLLEQSSAVTVLTNSMAKYLRSEAPFAASIKAPIHVIPTCTDLDHFSVQTAPHAEMKARLQGKKVLCYVGSFGGRYLSKEMARFYLAWRRHAGPSKFLVVSTMEPTDIRQVMQEAGVEDELVHQSATREQVPALIRCADAGVFFHPVTFANRGAAPTKLGEMLACGLPCAGNLIGDVPRVLGGENVGVVLEDFSDQSLDAAAKALVAQSALPGMSEKCRATAEEWFSLVKGLSGYEDIYRSLADKTRLPDASWPRPVVVTEPGSLLPP